MAAAAAVFTPTRPRIPPASPTDPALLNGPDSDTRWTNLGFWRGTRDYAEAARALARRTGEAAGLRAGDVVLDYACGHGDSLALWVREFSAARVIGVEADPEAAAVASRRVAAWGLADRVRVVHATAESFVVAREAPDASAVTCVDAAYHFLDRTAWLRGLAAALPPGTRIGFSDLTVSRRARRARFVHRVAGRAGIAESNLWVLEEIEPACAAAGVSVDRLVRCGHDVVGGFARFALRSALRFARRPTDGGWRALGTAAAIIRLRRGEGMGYAIIAARTVPRATPPRA